VADEVGLSSLSRKEVKETVLVKEDIDIFSMSRN
jgi:hypothetical protein